MEIKLTALAFRQHTSVNRKPTIFFAPVQLILIYYFY